MSDRKLSMFDRNFDFNHDGKLGYDERAKNIVELEDIDMDGLD